jgi:hypothetical protein
LAWDEAGERPDGEFYNSVLYGEPIQFGLWAIDFISRLRKSRCAVAAVLPRRVRRVALFCAHGGAGVL